MNMLSKIRSWFFGRKEEAPPPKRPVRFEVERLTDAGGNVTLECFDRRKQRGVFVLSDARCLWQRFRKDGSLFSEEELYLWPQSRGYFLVGDADWSIQLPPYVFHFPQAEMNRKALRRQLKFYLYRYAIRLDEQQRRNAAKPPETRCRSAADLPEMLRRELEMEFCPDGFPLELWINEKNPYYNRSFREGDVRHAREQKAERCLLDFFEALVKEHGESKAEQLLLERCRQERCEGS